MGAGSQTVGVEGPSSMLNSAADGAHSRPRISCMGAWAVMAAAGTIAHPSPPHSALQHSSPSCSSRQSAVEQCSSCPHLCSG